jgi:hypothetical protein
VERPTQVAELADVAYNGVNDLHEWSLLGGRCGQCEREGWIDSGWLQRTYRNSVISDLQPKLRCRKCGNWVGNKLIVGKLPR